ncbi:hypothetical protein V502_00436 [Pseudogymnoascus sp. VKM F-4520 (FW-2644)]|nr:hypothetical protein V502_00436 [Pseudogymnoascus sp. VKM F-4520 (FW-2644)]
MPGIDLGFAWPAWRADIQLIQPSDIYPFSMRYSATQSSIPIAALFSHFDLVSYLLLDVEASVAQSWLTRRQSWSLAAPAARKIKAVTRDVSKPAAKALVEKGVEVVSANMDDPESLRTVLKGAYAVFLVTNYWETMSVDIEKRQGMNELNVQHLIFSSLLNISKISNGVYTKVYHFDSKADVEDYIRSIGVPATFLLPAVYMSTLSKYFRHSPEPPHVFTLALPIPTDKPVIPLIYAEEDSGKFVKGILKHRDQLLGKRINAATKYYSTEEMVREFEDVYQGLGKGARAAQLPVDVYRDIVQKGGMPSDIAEEISQNLEMLADPGYFDGADVEKDHWILDEPVTTWKEFISTSKDFAGLKAVSSIYRQTLELYSTSLPYDRRGKANQSTVQRAHIASQHLWSGMPRETAQRWADEREMQTLTTAMGYLMVP